MSRSKWIVWVVAPVLAIVCIGMYLLADGRLFGTAGRTAQLPMPVPGQAQTAEPSPEAELPPQTQTPLDSAEATLAPSQSVSDSPSPTATAVNISVSSGKQAAQASIDAFAAEKFEEGLEYLHAAAQEYQKAAQYRTSDTAFLLGLKAQLILDTYEVNKSMYEANNRMNHDNAFLYDVLTLLAQDLIRYGGNIS